MPPAIPVEFARKVENAGVNHLRSMAEVKRYTVSATDGEMGHISDFIIDDETWQVRYLLAKTGSWLSGKQVLVSPQWIQAIEWADSRVSVDLPIDAIEASPEFDPDLAINREYEARLYNYYGKPVDW